MRSRAVSTCRSTRYPSVSSRASCAVTSWPALDPRRFLPDHAPEATGRERAGGATRSERSEGGDHVCMAGECPGSGRERLRAGGLIRARTKGQGASGGTPAEDGAVQAAIVGGPPSCTGGKELSMARRLLSVVALTG